MRKLTVLILAAGEGTRMKSKKAKVLHQVGGLPMLEFVVRCARAVSDDVRVVVGHQASAVQEAVNGVTFIRQDRQLGTGDAVMAARDSLQTMKGDLLILPGDVPLIEPETLRSFASFHSKGGFSASVMTAILEDPDGYGRVVRSSGTDIKAIVEHRDSDSDTLRIREINSGVYLSDSDSLFTALEKTGNSNAQGEYYLTDVFGIMSREGKRVGAFELKDPVEGTGINSRRELAAVDRRIRRRTCEALMASGVTILGPDTAWIDADVRIGADSLIHPSVSIEGNSVLGEEVTVRSFSRITNCRIGDRSTILDGSILADSEIHEEVQVGPHARLRPGVVLESRVRIGNFVELKKSHLDEGTKAGHLAYLGDAEIGKNVNIGAGTITCNYDGVSKYKTIIEDGVFIGSNSSLVAPVRIGRNAYVGAGSTITDDVPADSLALGRGRQVIKEGWVKGKDKKKH